MADRKVTIGPVALTNTLTTNIFSPAAAGSGTGYTPTATYAILRRIRIVNKDTVARTFSLWLGASGANAAGTEVIGNAYPISANSSFDWAGQMRVDSTQFLVGGASANTALTIEIEAELALA